MTTLHKLYDYWCTCGMLYTRLHVGFDCVLIVHNALWVHAHSIYAFNMIYPSIIILQYDQLHHLHAWAHGHHYTVDRCYCLAKTFATAYIIGLATQWYTCMQLRAILYAIESHLHNTLIIQCILLSYLYCQVHSMLFIIGVLHNEGYFFGWCGTINC